MASPPPVLPPLLHCQVTAPVRETAAQVLGAAVAPLGSLAVRGVVALLQQLIAQPTWDVRYAGYLGLKYALAGRQDVGLLKVRAKCGAPWWKAEKCGNREAGWHLRPD